MSLENDIVEWLRKEGPMESAALAVRANESPKKIGYILSILRKTGFVDYRSNYRRLWFAVESMEGSVDLAFERAVAARKTRLETRDAIGEDLEHREWLRKVELDRQRRSFHNPHL